MLRRCDLPSCMRDILPPWTCSWQGSGQCIHGDNRCACPPISQGICPNFNGWLLCFKHLHSFIHVLQHRNKVIVLLGRDDGKGIQCWRYPSKLYWDTQKKEEKLEKITKTISGLFFTEIRGMIWIGTPVANEMWTVCMGQSFWRSVPTINSIIWRLIMYTVRERSIGGRVFQGQTVWQK